MEASGTSRSGGVVYRYRTGETLSAWMTSAELRTHAAAGRIKADSGIQQRGREDWIPAGKVPGLWVSPGGTTAGGASMHDAAPAPAEPQHTPEPAGEHNAHHTRLGETMQHLLQRAVLTHVHVMAPEMDAPVTALLAGVTSDGVGLDFEAQGTVVLLPWSRVRAVAAPRAIAYSSARVRDSRESGSTLTVEVDHLPQAVTQAQQAV